MRPASLKERAMSLGGVRECPKTRTVEDECLKSRAVEDRRTGNIKKKWKRNFSLLLFLYACMHSVCTLYASPTAYIFVLSALRTRLFAFLYALYAVNSGVVFSHSMHSRFFDAYNAYKSQAMWFVMNCGRIRPKGTGNEARWAIRMGRRYSYMPEDANREKFDCPQPRAVEDRRTGNIKKKWKRNFSLFLFYMLVCILYAVCMHP